MKIKWRSFAGHEIESVFVRFGENSLGKKVVWVNDGDGEGWLGFDDIIDPPEFIKKEKVLEGLK